MSDAIELRGVRVHNLRGVDLQLPLGRLTVITGVSGAGKSSLAVDTLYAEAQRRYLQSFSAHTRQYLERFDRPDAEWIGDLPPAIAVGPHVGLQLPRATVSSLTEIGPPLRLLFARAGEAHCPDCGAPMRAYTTEGIVAAVEAYPAGMRFTVAFPGQIEADTKDWAQDLVEEGFTRVQVAGQTYRLGAEAAPEMVPGQRFWVLVDRLEAGKAAVERVRESIETALARGAGRVAFLLDDRVEEYARDLRCPSCDTIYPPLQPRLFDADDPLGACPVCGGTGMVDGATCNACKGSRYGPLTRAVRLAGRTIADVDAGSLDSLLPWLGEVKEFAGDGSTDILLAEITRCLGHLAALALGHLNPGRPASTLSVGELRRIRLATALASDLAGALFILDEPTAGLHPTEVAPLLDELRRLRDTGSTVVVIEHHREAIAAADHVVDLGPGAGEDGGTIMYAGPVQGLAEAPPAPTSDFWTGRSAIAIPTRRRQTSGELVLSGASVHNLRDLSVTFPLGVLCAVTGVSGAGKRSLVEHTLYPALCQAKKKKCGMTTQAVVRGASAVGDVVLIDQAPRQRSARSNPATALKVFDDIRALFAQTTEARIRNFGPGHFSFNQPGGRCETCAGEGTLSVDMQFLADVTATCPECQGRRYRKEILDIRVRSLNVTDVLDLTVREAFRFFRAQTAIERRLKFLLDVGLDYVRLGQAINTLSGGETQRLDLAAHLASARKSRSLFILLEPSAGLHPADVAVLLGCFDGLLEAGHSVLVVEHDLDVIACADHVIDMGPEGGAGGGRVVTAGTPEEIAATSGSHTGTWLKRRLEPE